MTDASPASAPTGQLSPTERQILRDTVLQRKPRIVLEVGTWLGGGSTFHILRALQENGQGHLWGVEYVKSIYEKMIDNIRTHAPDAWQRFTPLLGKSSEVIPQWIREQPAGFQLDLAFLDGGDNPMEQIVEFELIDAHMPVGSVLFAHDAKKRKAKWFSPYLRLLDHWKMEVLDTSSVGLIRAEKIAAAPSPASLAAARADLARRRWEPIELVARFVPTPVCAFVLKCLPRGICNKLGQP